MKLPETIHHHGKSIYYIDFSHLNSIEEITTVIHHAKTYIRNQPPKSLLVLVSISMMHINTVIKELFVDFITGNRDHIYASAVIGLNSLSQVVFKNTIRQTRRDIKAFQDITDAKNWLSAKISLETARLVAN